MGIVEILAIIVILLAVLSLIPQTSQWPMLSVAMLLVGIALFFIGKH
jgi:hypothetical protein